MSGGNITETSRPLVQKVGTITSTETVSGTIDASLYDEVMFELFLGNMPAETIDFRIEECTAADGTGAQSLLAATQLAAHASNNDNEHIVLAVRTTKVSSGFRYLRGRAITGDVTGGPACIVGRSLPRYAPVAAPAACAETKFAV